jgi:hypothetical protein
MGFARQKDQEKIFKDLRIRCESCFSWAVFSYRVYAMLNFSNFITSIFPILPTNYLIFSFEPSLTCLLSKDDRETIF